MTYDQLKTLCHEYVNTSAILVHAIETGNMDRIDLLLKIGADPDKLNLMDWDHPAALHVAAKKGRRAAVIALLDAGADPNKKNGNDATALILATKYRHIGVMEELINHSQATRDGLDTSLLIAAESGFEDGLKFLIDAGADITKHTKHNTTALHLAAYNGHTDIVKLITSKCIGLINKRDLLGDTPLHNATEKLYPGCVKLLIEASADVTIQNQGGYTPLRIATTHGSHHIVKLLTTYLGHLKLCNIARIFVDLAGWSPWVIMWIGDFDPEIHSMTALSKIRLIEGVFASIRKVHEARIIK
jgi:ankyrin repeat protein